MAIVYRHIRKDKNQVFYIGISHGIERAYKKSQRNDIWKNIVKKTDYEVEILFDDLSWEDAANKEIELISLYGRKNNSTGCLANMTDGGEGTRGWTVTEESRIRMSESKKGISATWNKGRKFSEEHKKKLSDKSKITRNGRKLVCNIETGIFYYGVKEAAIAYGYNTRTLHNKLSKNAQLTNNTKLIYV
jgi:hypothetical protein